MSWHKLENIHQLEEIREISQNQPVVIFKHSTRCPISTAAWDRMNRSGTSITGFAAYFLDLIRYREISNRIAGDWQVEHQSPQVILIWKGEAVYDASHFDIRFQEVADRALQLTRAFKN